MKRAILIFSLFFISFQADAGTINLQNGNYTVVFNDMKIPWSGGVWTLKRIYNSGSNYKGFFGYSFGSNIENRLTIHPDGSVEHHNVGSGANQVFTNKGYSGEKIATVVEKIISNLPGPKQNDEERKKIIGDYQYRQKMARKFGIKAIIPVGTKFITHDLGKNWLEKHEKGWILKQGKNVQLLFNNEGKMIKKIYDAKYALHFSYNNNKRLNKISDQSGATLLTLSYNSDGFVTETRHAPKSWTSKYKYKFFTLLHSDDGNFKYDYRYDKHDNLAKIIDPNGKSEEMKYDHNWKGRIKFHKSMDNVATTYNFVPLDKNAPYKHFRVNLEKKFVGNRAPASSAPFKNASYTFFFGTAKDGQKILDWTEVTERGVATKTKYGRPHGLPKEITQNGKTTKLSYYESGLLKTKTLPTGEVINLTYNQKHRKVSKVKRDNVDISYEYDSKGNLKSAYDSVAKKKITLWYDGQNRITKMGDSKNESLSFTYNQQGRPETITVGNKGTLKPVYDSKGNVIDMKSSNGRKLTIQAQKVFSSLVRMVKPAGVKLGFGDSSV